MASSQLLARAARQPSVALHCWRDAGLRAWAAPGSRTRPARHLNMCMASSCLPSTEEMRIMMTAAGAFVLVVGFKFFTSGALISTRPAGQGAQGWWLTWQTAVAAAV